MPANAPAEPADAAARRILFVLGAGYLPGTVTGANISLHALCQRLRGVGFEPIVVCRTDPPGSGPGLDWGPLRYTVLRLADPGAALAEMIGVLAPAAIVIRGLATAARAAEFKAAREFRIRVYLVANFIGQGQPAPEGLPHWRFGANSRFLARIAEAYFGAPVSVVPPLVEPSSYRCTPEGDAVLFINPVADKGVHVAAAIARRLPHRRFVFVKSWPDQAGHRHVDVRLPNVEWAESTVDMRALYRRARLLLVPSVCEETWSRAVTEAQLSGIPAVASDRGGLAENVGAGGVVLGISDPVARWCEVIERLYADRKAYSRLARAAKAHAMRREIAPAAVLRKFLKFIDDEGRRGGGPNR